MRDALVAGELARYVNELNPQFHGVIYRSARRPTLAQLIDKLRQCARVYALALAQSSTPSVDFAAVHREHEQIVAALRARESQAASGIMRLHVERSAHQLLASLVEPLR
jgi:DNA-binding GntR family transcriptional regulator